MAKRRHRFISGIQALTGAMKNRFFRAALVQAGVLLLAVMISALIAAITGGSVTALMSLILFAPLSVFALALHLPGQDDAPSDAEIALKAFREKEDGQFLAAEIERLAASRARLGRAAPMYRTLDRLVRGARRIEKRAATEPPFRKAQIRALKRQLPMIASTAENYAAISSDPEAKAGEPELKTAEGALVSAVAALEKIEQGMTGLDEPETIRRLRLETDAELLAEEIKSGALDTEEAAQRARLAHRLRLSAREARDEDAALLRKTAIEIERGKVPDALQDAVQALPPDAQSLPPEIMDLLRPAPQPKEP